MPAAVPRQDSREILKARMETESQNIILRSDDGETFEIPEKVALESETIKHMIEDGCARDPIPLPNVNAKTLSMVIEYCKKHVEATAMAPGRDKKIDAELTKWDQDFADVDSNTLYDLIMAANYLSIKGLLDLGCQTVANSIKGKTPEEIRQKFGIKNDFTPEEYEEIRKENQWAFE